MRHLHIVGLVAAADLSRSDYKSYDTTIIGDVSFSNLVLDESKCRGVLIFRLAENLGTIVVHERIKQSVLAAGIDTLKFIKPEDWIQI